MIQSLTGITAAPDAGGPFLPLPTLLFPNGSGSSVASFRFTPSTIVLPITSGTGRIRGHNASSTPSLAAALLPPTGAEVGVTVPLGDFDVTFPMGTQDLINVNLGLYPAFPGGITGVSATPETRIDHFDFQLIGPGNSGMNLLTNVRPSPTLNLPLLFGGDDLSCKKALKIIYSRHPTGASELIWGYQIIQNVCADWLEVSPGLLYDPTLATGSRTLNTSFGVRVYSGEYGSDNTWLTNTTGAPIGRGDPIPFPSWNSPILVPWMGKPLNLLVEFYTNGDTINAGTILEVATIPMLEG